MPEAVNPVTPEQAAKNRQDDFARAQARREEVARRREELGGEPDMSHEFDWSQLKPNPSAIWYIENEEPTFTFRAQDILSVLVLDEYARLLERYDPASEKLAHVVEEINKFREWQRSNPGKVKLPD